MYVQNRRERRPRLLPGGRPGETLAAAAPVPPLLHLPAAARGSRRTAGPRLPGRSRDGGSPAGARRRPWTLVVYGGARTSGRRPRDPTAVAELPLLHGVWQPELAMVAVLRSQRPSSSGLRSVVCIGLRWDGGGVRTRTRRCVPSTPSAMRGSTRRGRLAESAVRKTVRRALLRPETPLAREGPRQGARRLWAALGRPGRP
jgi:hypothetical protein